VSDSKKKTGGRRRQIDEPELKAFWSMPSDVVLGKLQASAAGFTDGEAGKKLEEYGPNILGTKARTDTFTLLLSQFKSPLVLILVFAAILAFFFGDVANPIIILVIVIISGLLGFWQERGANNAAQKLIALVQVKATVFRSGQQKDVPLESVVPGDITVLNAGDVIPGDCLILESKDLFVDEAILTGETYPVEKAAGILGEGSVLGQRTNSLFMGTHVISGSARAAVIYTGKSTEFGKVSERLKLRPAETEFEHGVRRFGIMLVEITLVLVIAIFAINVFFHRPVLEALLFAGALAVGLTPQLLPAIISVNLSQGAKAMASQKVIVKRLASIENFGSMNVLCSDKTGTLTEGIVHVRDAFDVDGVKSEKVLFYAYLNAYYETGFSDPIDDAIRTYCHPDITGYKKLDEIPYDFVRKRISILVEKDSAHIVVTKGALSHVLQACSRAETGTQKVVDIEAARAGIQKKFEELSLQGFRMLGVAYRDVGGTTVIHTELEADMTFIGFLVLFDPPRSDAAKVIADLKELGVSLKIITGDNRLVTATVCREVGIANPRVLAASDLEKISDMALISRVKDVDAFAEVEPNQKERIIIALKKAGNVTGFMGDGINDASALHAADVSISVESAVDVAKEAADIVLMEKDLGVLTGGIRAGRTTFSNTLKYVFMAASANFGNMFSMAGASLFLPFLPLLPVQILLMNLMTDLPEMAIATDSVDPELVEKPRRWDIKSIRNFMLTFGLLSSVFDYVTFGVLLLIMHATMPEFRAGWFMESVVSAAMVVLVIRTRRPFYKSRPGKYLLLLTVIICAVALVFPYTPLGEFFHFQYPPAWVIPVILGIVVLYVAGAEITKKIFYRRAGL
jgi:P-type Mg2+ transporter